MDDMPIAAEAQGPTHSRTDSGRAERVCDLSADESLRTDKPVGAICVLSLSHGDGDATDV